MEITAEYPVWRSLSDDEIQLRACIVREREMARALKRTLIQLKLPDISPHVHYANLCEGLAFLVRRIPEVSVKEALERCEQPDVEKAWRYCCKAKWQFIASLTKSDDSEAFLICAQTNFIAALTYCGHNLLFMDGNATFPKPSPEDIEELRRAFAMHDKDLGNFRECQRESYYEPKPPKATKEVRPVSEQSLAALRSSKKRDIYLSAKLETALVRNLDPVKYMRDLGYIHVSTRNEEKCTIYYFAGIGKTFAIVKDEKYALYVV